MEQWQRLVIKRHLPELVDLTSCNTELLTRLFSKDILTDEEIHEIEVTKNPKKKARKLYGLLVTRTNAYHLFLATCKEIRQTGVVSILEDGESQHKLLTQDECKVIHPSPFNNKSASEPILDKSPLLKTSSIKATEPPTTSNFDHGLSLSRYQQQSLSEAPNSSNVKSSSEALPISSISRADKIPSPEDNDTQSSSIKGAFQSVHKLSQNPHQEITGSLEKCHISKSKTQITTDELKMDVSNKHQGDLSKLGSNGSALNINQPDNEGRTILHRALADGESFDVIKNLIGKNADYKTQDISKQGVLHFAVRGGNKEVIIFLMSLKLDINEVDELGETPLHKVQFTKNRDYLGITKFLLNNGAKLLNKNKNGDAVAHLLSLNKNISCDDFQIWAKGMIKIGQGYAFAIRGQYGRTPLQNAIQRLDLSFATIKLILESSKVHINQTDDNGDTLLQLALQFGRSLETIKNLIILGANIKIKNQVMSGFLHFAVIVGNKEVIQYLISRGLDVNDTNNDGNTPLHTVRETRSKNYVELTNLLVDNGADLCSKNKDGNTLGHELVIWKDVSCDDFKLWVTGMIENGHSRCFTIRGQVGRTPLHSALLRLDLDLETIKLIIKSAKLDINQPDDQGNTMLNLALLSGRSLDTIKSLVELGADWKRKSRDGRSVLHVAVIGSSKEAFLYFKSLGADVNAKHKYGRTPLHYVPITRSKDYLGMTKFLLENGANLNAEDNFGRTLDYWTSSNKDISTKEYRVWKEGMIQLGYAAFFKQLKSS